VVLFSSYLLLANKHGKTYHRSMVKKMSEVEVETITLPKSVFDCVRSTSWFESYKRLENVVIEAIIDWLEAKGSANIVHIHITQQKQVTGYGIRRGKVNVEVDMDTYLRFEKGAKRLGMTVNEAFGHGVYALVEGKAGK